MKKLFAFVISLLFVLNACHQTTKTQQEDSSLFNWENAQSFTSDDSKFEFMIMADPGNKEGIVLLDKNSGTIYHLAQVAAASGVKYANEDGFTFWTKGNDFIWSNHMDMIASGKVKQTNLPGYHTNEELGSSLVDSITFNKVLQGQGIEFSVSAVRIEDGQTKLTVSPFGLEIDNREQIQTFYGSIVEAEIEDLNSDGSPELLIYIQSDGSGCYGNVIAYSVNNKKSMSMVNFPPVSENKTLSKGYMGHDEFRIVENLLVQRFPIYKEGDSNANPTGGIRQISYQMEEGEAMRQFVIKNIATFNR